MSNCLKKYIFHIKSLKTGFVANEKWRQAPGFELLHHIYFYVYVDLFIIAEYYIMFIALLIVRHREV